MAGSPKSKWNRKWEKRKSDRPTMDFVMFGLQATLESIRVCGNETSPSVEWPGNSSVTFHSIDAPVDVCYYIVFADVSAVYDRFDPPPS